MDLWVVIPAYNEERSLGATLRRLTEQTDAGFTPVVVDNASTDGTAELVLTFAAEHPELDLRLIEEAEKGTGAAADTGVRHAIAAGATHIARTDADCLPHTGWIVAVKRAFDSGLEMASGYPLAMAEARLVARTVLAAAPLELVRREAARRVLLPTYRRLTVRRNGRIRA